MLLGRKTKIPNTNFYNRPGYKIRKGKTRSR